MRVRRVTRARAAGDGLYLSWVIACSTRSRVAGRTPGTSFSTRETVWCETPARRATSKMFAPRMGLSAALMMSSCSLVRIGLRHDGQQHVDGHGLGIQLGDRLPIAQNEDTVADPQHLFELR